MLGDRTLVLNPINEAAERRRLKAAVIDILLSSSLLSLLAAPFMSSFTATINLLSAFPPGLLPVS